MLIKDNKNVDFYKEDLDKLFITCFDGLRYAESDPAEFRSLQMIDSHVVSYAAVQERAYDFISKKDIKTYILGYVSTLPEYRFKGFAQKAVWEILEEFTGDNWIIVLNCVIEKVPFYDKFGFEIICNKSSNERNGVIDTDDCPVMALFANPSLRQSIIGKEVMFLGPEF